MVELDAAPSEVGAGQHAPQTLDGAGQCSLPLVGEAVISRAVVDGSVEILVEARRGRCLPRIVVQVRQVERNESGMVLEAWHDAKA